MEPMSQMEALHYFGLPETAEGKDQLEDLLAGYDIGVVLDESDNIELVDPTELKEVLFEEHKKKVGHRPDSPSVMEAEQQKLKQKEKDKKDKMEADKEKLKDKVNSKPPKVPKE